MQELYTWGSTSKGIVLTKRELKNMKKNMKKVPIIKDLSEKYHEKELEDLKELEKKLFE